MAATFLGAAAAAGGLKAGLSTVLTGLSVAGSVISTVGALRQANAEANFQKSQADQAVLEAGQERLSFENERLETARRLAAVLGENDVRTAAAGIDLTAGFAENTRAAAKKRAAQEIDIERRDSAFRQTQHKLRGAALTRRARETRSAGGFTAAGNALQAGISIARRG